MVCSAPGCAEVADSDVSHVDQFSERLCPSFVADRRDRGGHFQNARADRDAPQAQNHIALERSTTAVVTVALRHFVSASRLPVLLLSPMSVSATQNQHDFE